MRPTEITTCDDPGPDVDGPLRTAFDDDEAAAMLVARLLIEQDDRLVGASQQQRRRRHRRSRRMTLAVLSPICLALAVVGAVALWPSARGGGAGRPGPTLRPLAAASGASTIRALAANTQDTGTGPVRHVRIEYFRIPPAHAAGSGDLERLGEDEAWGVDGDLLLRTTAWMEKGSREAAFPAAPTSTLQRCSPGKWGGTCPISPDAAVFHAAPHPFPSSLEAGRAALDAAAAEFNEMQGLRSSTNTTPDGIVTIPQQLDRPRVALLLATSVAYDAADRRAVLRVLAAEPSARLVGPAADAMGRPGIEVELASTTTALTPAGLDPATRDAPSGFLDGDSIPLDANAGVYAARDVAVSIRAILDVDGGRVLSTTTHVGISGAGDVMRVFIGPARVQAAPVLPGD